MINQDGDEDPSGILPRARGAEEPLLVERVRDGPCDEADRYAVDDDCRRNPVIPIPLRILGK